MVDRFPDAPALAGRRWPRDWHSYEQYQVVHQNYMDVLVSEGIVVNDGIVFRESRLGSSLVEVNVRGRVRTLSGAILTVNKWLEVAVQHGRVNVRTREYDYHAHVQVDGRDQNLFRYDNCHGGVDSLHRHQFDTSGSELETIAVARDRMPTLNLVIEEAEFCAAYLRRAHRPWPA